jgi:hypothetical protein
MLEFKINILLILLLIIFLLRKGEETEHFMIPVTSDKYTIAEKLGKHYISNVANLSRKNGEKLAVMFDIDDTLLYVTGKVTLIKPIKNLLDFCISQGLLIIIITARDSSYKHHTQMELNKYSINYSSLYLHERFPGETNEDFYNFKSNIKKYLYDKYKIKVIMSLGDQDLDVIGEYAGYGIKLPNKKDSALYEVFPNSSLLTKVV